MTKPKKDKKTKKRRKESLEADTSPSITDEAKEDDVAGDGHHPSTTTGSEASNKPARNKRRKRKHSANATQHDTKPSSSLFNGIILAISTLESRNATNEDDDNKADASAKESTAQEDDPYKNYKTLTNLLKSHNATLSPQVHKRVHYIISTPSAIQNLTQRVRQALKRNVDIVHVDWVKACIERGERVDVSEYLCNDVAKKLMVEKEDVKKGETAGSKDEETGGGRKGGGYESDIPEEDNAGWSSPIQLDCCCVCHENGDLECPWCLDCNLTLARKNRQA